LRAQRGEPALALLNNLLEHLQIEIVPFDAALARLAVKAFGRFGKGMGHKAQLNFGDCAVYALCESLDQSVLALGNDFSATGLRLA
jgi:ribonuclease VapC